MLFVRPQQGMRQAHTELCASAATSQSTQHQAKEDVIPEAELQAIIQEFRDVLVDELPPGLPPERDVPHTIPLEPGKVPPCRPMYRLSPVEFAEMERQVKDLLARGYIQPSTSPFGAPILFVQKKDGSLRMVIDYRALNLQTIRNRYPMPRVDEMLELMQGCSVFSTFDLYAGYHQLRITEADCPKTAFRTPLGHFEFKVLPFGLANAPATFQAQMNRILEPVQAFAKAYLDDIVVRSRNAEEHKAHLRQLLQLLREHRLYAELPKCTFNRPEVPYLGHVVGRYGLKVDPAMVATVAEWPVPSDAQQVRQFLGLTNYFRKFIMGYAALAAPLQALTQKHRLFQWTPECQASFERLKQALCSAPVLKLPDITRPFTVISDASLHGTGAVLMQDDRAVAYTSKKFNQAERNYHTTDQELLGVIRALSEFRCFLEGCKFTILTDHSALVHLKAQPQPSRRQNRWLEYLQQFEPGIEWQHRAGRTMIADPLSRNPALLSLAFCPLLLSTAEPRNDLLARIKQGYEHDGWIRRTAHQQAWARKHGLWLVNRAIVVPNFEDLRPHIIRLHHAPRYAGHPGVHKTFKAVAQNFYWPSLLKDVQGFVNSCDSCQRVKASNQPPSGLLQPLELPDRRWAHVSMDFITGLPTTNEGHNAILVFVDKLSKMARFAPTATTASSKEVARLFTDKVGALFGLPSKIITDRDPTFTGQWFGDFCRRLGIHQALSTSFHPQTDGQTERTNRVLEDFLRHFISPQQTDWHDLLPAAEFAVNNSVHDSHGYTPAFLNFGQHPLSPITLQTDDTVPAARLHATQMQEAVEVARSRLKQAQDRQKAYADTKRRDITFHPGQPVLLSTKNINIKAGPEGTRKLLPRFMGPFPVLHMVGPAAVKLELPPHYRLHPVFHVSLIRRYNQTRHTDVPPPPLDVDTDGAPFNEAEAILAHRPAKGANKGSPWEFYVKWQGYSHEHNSWIPISCFAHPQALLKPYWQSIGGEPPVPSRKQRDRAAGGTGKHPPKASQSPRQTARHQAKRAPSLAAGPPAKRPALPQQPRTRGRPRKYPPLT